MDTLSESLRPELEMLKAQTSVITTKAEAFEDAKNTRIAELEAEIEALKAGGVERLRSPAEPKGESLFAGNSPVVAGWPSLDGLAPAAVEPVASEHPYFSYDPDVGFDTHRTEEEARQAAKESIGQYRDMADETWPDEVTEVRYGLILGKSFEIDLQDQSEEGDRCVEFDLRPTQAAPTTKAEPAPEWDGKLHESLQRSLNALRLECPPALVNDLEFEVRKSFEALSTSLAVSQRMYGAARDRLDAIDAAQPDPFATPAAPADALDAETIKKAQRYDWLRHADLDAMAARYWPDQDVPEGADFDAVVDAAMVAAQTKGDA